jgi:glycosyltransferase involved in cell wall biosynthesis
VLAFGTYDRSYPRNAQVRAALRSAGVHVVELNLTTWDSRHNWAVGPRRLMRIAHAEARLARAAVPPDVDVLLVGYPGHFDLPAARRAAAGRPIVFDPLVSLYDTIVADRARFGTRSPAAYALRLVDRHAFRAADLVVADTREQAAFYARAFGLDRDRVGVCMVGADDRLFRPEPRPTVPFSVLFVGKLIPLHGVETILAAARLAPDIPFRIVGEGQLDHLLACRPPNVDWVRWIDYERLPTAYLKAGCALGVFGTGAKTARVIPNKAFQALATATPLVTADTPAARELLTDGASALLVPPGDPEALAGALRRLADDATLRGEVGRAGRVAYEAHASTRVLGARWRELLTMVVGLA